MKKIKKITTVVSIIIALCISINHYEILAASQSNNYHVFESKGKYGFFDDNGNVVIQPKYDDVWEESDIDFTNYFDSDIIAANHIGFMPFEYGVTRVKVGKKWGIIDIKDHMIVKPMYDTIVPYCDGTYLVGAKGKVGIMNRSGQLLTPIKYEYIGIMSEGMAKIKLGNHMGYIDKNGKEVIPAKFPWPEWTDKVYESNFSEGLAMVYTEKNSDGHYKIGYIDKSGNMVLKTPYYSGEDFSEGIAEVRFSKDDEEYLGYIDKNGKLLFSLLLTGDFGGYTFKHGVMIFDFTEDDVEGCGLIDKNGKVIIKPTYFDMRRCSNGNILAISNTGNPTIYNNLGKVLFNSNQVTINGDMDTGFDSISEDMIKISIKQLGKVKQGFLDLNKNCIIVPEVYAKELHYFSDGMALFVAEDNKIGYINKNGKAVIKPIYNSGSDFNNGAAKVGVNIKDPKRQVYINKLGKIIFQQ